MHEAVFRLWNWKLSAPEASDVVREERSQTSRNIVNGSSAMRSFGPFVQSMAESHVVAVYIHKEFSPQGERVSEAIRIIRFHPFGDASILQLDKLPLPSSGKGEIRLHMKAISLNRTKIIFREGRYIIQASQFPSTLGYEALSIVEAVQRC